MVEPLFNKILTKRSISIILFGVVLFMGAALFYWKDKANEQKNSINNKEEQKNSSNDCIRSGCSGQLCLEPGKERMTTCEYRPEYACYKEAICERQDDGSCGWRQTDSLSECLKKGRGKRGIVPIE